MFINEAYAATSNVATVNPAIGTGLQLFFILIIFYFFLIRPQMKKAKEHSAMVEGLKTGDRILTNGGLYGKVSKVKGLELEVEIASGVVVTIDRMSVFSVKNDTKSSGEVTADSANKKKTKKVKEK